MLSTADALRVTSTALYVEQRVAINDASEAAEGVGRDIMGLVQGPIMGLQGWRQVWVLYHSYLNFCCQFRD